MSNESRAAFEAWYMATHQNPSFSLLTYGDYAHLVVREAWSAWQASRKVAIEEATAIVRNCEDYTRADAWVSIKELLK